MAPPPFPVPSVRKVAAILSVFCAVICAIMYRSMHHSSLTLFFVLLAAVPIALIWTLVIVARYLEKKTEPQTTRRGIASTDKGKKRLTGTS